MVTALDSSYVDDSALLSLALATDILRVAAAVPGAAPERKEFTPTRGGYGEMTVVPKMPTEASVHLALNPQGDELPVSAQLIRPGKAPEAWPADLTLKPGMYEAFFRRPDYKDILLPFTVPQGQQTITLKGPVITPVFKEVKFGVAKVLGMFAKRARGAMARYIIKNRMETPERIKDFGDGGYAYRPDLSEDDTWVFTRDKSS